MKQRGVGVPIDRLVQHGANNAKVINLIPREHTYTKRNTRMHCKMLGIKACQMHKCNVNE